MTLAVSTLRAVLGLCLVAIGAVAFGLWMAGL